MLTNMGHHLAKASIDRCNRCPQYADIIYKPPLNCHKSLQLQICVLVSSPGRILTTTWSVVTARYKSFFSPYPASGAR